MHGAPRILMSPLSHVQPGFLNWNITKFSCKNKKIYKLKNLEKNKTIEIMQIFIRKI